MATQKHSYDTKGLHPFQADELHANAIPNPRKNSAVKMQLTFCGLPCNPSKKEDRGLKNTAIWKCLQWAVSSESLSDTFKEESRGDHSRHPSWNSAEPSRGCTPVALLFRKKTSLFALKVVHILFFFYKQGRLRKSRTDYLQAHQLQKTIPYLLLAISSSP